MDKELSNIYHDISNMAADVYGHVQSSSDINSDLNSVGHLLMDQTSQSGNVLSPLPASQSFSEYSPKNSQLVHILTSTGTPSKQYVNIDDTFIDSQESQISQDSGFVPNQDFIANLDR